MSHSKTPVKSQGVKNNNKANVVEGPTSRTKTPTRSQGVDNNKDSLRKRVWSLPAKGRRISRVETDRLQPKIHSMCIVKPKILAMSYDDYNVDNGQANV